MKDFLFNVFSFEKENEAAEQLYELKELAVSSVNFPPENYVTKILKNPIYEIPEFILPPSRPYEIEVKIIFFLFEFSERNVFN